MRFNEQRLVNLEELEIRHNMAVHAVDQEEDQVEDDGEVGLEDPSEDKSWSAQEARGDTDAAEDETVDDMDEDDGFVFPSLAL